MRSSERNPIHPSNPSTDTTKTICLTSESITASSKPPIPKTTVQVLSYGSERTGGATPTRSEDPEDTVLPGRPVTADLHQLKAIEESLEVSSRNPEGSNQRPHATPVEKPAEKFEIAKKLGESPEGDSMSNSGNQHELHLRNLSPSTEKISSRNPKEPVRDLYRPSRDLVEKSEDRTTGQNASSPSPPQHHRSDRTTDHRISPSLGPASPPVSRQPQEEPIRVPRRGLNKALKRRRRLLRFETNLRTWELPARIFHQTTPPHKQYPSLGIAAVVQRRKAGRNETRRRDGYSARRRLTLRNGVGIPEDVPSEFSSYRQYTIPTAPRYSEKQRTKSNPMRCFHTQAVKSPGKLLDMHYLLHWATPYYSPLGTLSWVAFPYRSAMPPTALAGSFDELRVESCPGDKTHC
ncbi:hypothetical protein EAE96_004076 [Botrytis aclada]|nr:hypothetical protein EAE96_004076 [Botrytis aclada]